MKASIIIVTYNSSGFIKECLLSLESQSCRDFEVILVDNNSKDDIASIIESLKDQLMFPLKTFWLDQNMGFTGGNNHGLNHASGKYIALLNPDTCADKFWLEEITTSMKSHTEAGICASKLMVYGTNNIDSAGDGFSTFLKGFKRGDNENASLYEKNDYVFGACAGAALYRRKMIEEIGLFDDDFFLIHEDTDLNFRAQLAGWKVLYVPSALVYHKVRSSIGHMSDMAVYYTLRNSEFVKIKNLPTGIFTKYLFNLLLSMIMEFIYYVAKHKKLKLYFKAKSDVIRMLPVMLKKRKTIMKNKKATNSYINNIMTSVWQWSYLKSKVRKLVNG